ncbi:MAG: hypothetical protein VYC14_02370 [Actinomycetota bacterium]|jgi:hypothetical protein|nr:hypothetical protein [Actinomycetota bacterium]|tara:strand:+ start:985 stop:1869 length:885 start_codon:yes stop_codon:yes gene_type:complete
MNHNRLLAYAHLLTAGGYLVFTLVGPWAKRGDSFGVFSSDGGTGFGIIGFIFAVILVFLAIFRLIGRSEIIRGLGVEQLTLVIGIAAWLNLICFVVGWLPIFEYGQGRRRGVPGTGWGVVGAYFTVSQIPLLLSPLTLGIPSPSRGIKALEANKRQAFSVTTVICGIGLMIFPYLAWVASGSVELSAFDGRNGNPTSGPRFGYLLFAIGVALVIAGLMRLRPKGLAEPGPNLLLSHCLLGAAVLALTMPLGIIISCLQRSGLDIGIGTWLTLATCLVLISLGIAENKSRNAVGV